jgi:hypothetical protein
MGQFLGIVPFGLAFFMLFDVFGGVFHFILLYFWFYAMVFVYSTMIYAIFFAFLYVGTYFPLLLFVIF